MNVQIITESTADLSKELIETYKIDVIPLQVSDGENEYLDGVTLTSHNLFENMRNGTVYKTSLASMDQLEKTFLHYAVNDIPAVYVSFSSQLSGTYQAATIVKKQVQEEYPNLNLEIIDSKCASLGQGLVVLKAAQMAQEGKTVAEITDEVQFRAKHMEHIFTVDDLQYLVRGGRLSKAAGFVGGLLQIKPILHVEDGQLIPIEKIRGRKKVFQRMVDLMEERGVKLSEQTIGISHGDDLESALRLKEMIEEKFGCKEFVITSIGASVGSHTGPGTMTLFFLNKER